MSTQHKEVHNVSRHPWTGSQKATVVISGLLVVAFTAFMALSSGKPAWWGLLVLAPVASWLSYRENANRKKSAQITVRINDGVLTCDAPKSDTMSIPVNGITSIGLAELSDGTKFIVVAGEDAEGNEGRVRIPLKFFRHHHTVSAELLALRESQNVDISKQAEKILTSGN